MPKAKDKKDTKRTVKCGKCKETGHNARTCPTSKTTKGAAPVPPKKPGSKTKIDARDLEPKRRMSTVPKRDAPTAGNTSNNNYAPYRCPKCTQVAILVAVRVKDYVASQKKDKTIYASELRCEKCMNKPPAELILKWGCRPNEKVPVPGQDA